MRQRGYRSGNGWSKNDRGLWRQRLGRLLLLRIILCFFDDDLFQRLLMKPFVIGELSSKIGDLVLQVPKEGILLQVLVGRCGYRG